MDRQACLAWIQSHFHPEGTKCPHCGVSLEQARTERGKRGYIERYFALRKHYFRLNHLRTQGLLLAYRHAFEVALSVLLAAWLADQVGRPDLLHARPRLLAPY
jgi:hypothetical protein